MNEPDVLCLFSRAYSDVADPLGLDKYIDVVLLDVYLIEQLFAGAEGELVDDRLLSEDELLDGGRNVEGLVVEGGESPLALEGVGVDGRQQADNCDDWKNVYHVCVII